MSDEAAERRAIAEMVRLIIRAAHQFDEARLGTPAERTIAFIGLREALDVLIHTTNDVTEEIAAQTRELQRQIRELEQQLRVH